MRCATSKMYSISFGKCLSCMVVPFFSWHHSIENIWPCSMAGFFLFVRFRHLNDVSIFMVWCKRGEFPHSILCTCFDQNGNESIKNVEKKGTNKTRASCLRMRNIFQFKSHKTFSIFQMTIKFSFSIRFAFFHTNIKTSHSA